MNLEAIWKRIETGFIVTGRRRVRADLLRMDDRHLADCGFSRALLEQGVAAWPWRAPVEEERSLRLTVPTPPRELDQVGLARAAAELRRYSDAELLDLGIARGGIDAAVRHGRPGFEDLDRRVA